VDIGGIDGMVHVSELSWNRVRQPSDILNVGDEIDVYVISFDKRTARFLSATKILMRILGLNSRPITKWAM
jgi:ribosomal protein S1